MKAMLLTKLKTVTAVLVVLGMFAFGGGLYLHQAEAQQGPADKSPAAGEKGEKKGKSQQKQEQKQEKEGFTAWGKEINGLQAGLGYRRGGKRAYSHGETVKLIVRVRNVGKETVPFEYVYAFLVENPPAVTDADGKPIPLPRFIALGAHGPTRVDLAPGKEIEIHELKLELRPASESGNKKYSTLYGTGKFSIQYDRVIGKSSAGTEADPTLSKLATGKLELEIKTDPAPAAPGKKERPKQEKEAFTAWGKEINGLQAGLGFRPGQKRAYHHGEEATVVLRVRNVGKEAVEFKHIGAFFVENPPTITDAEGKRAQLPRVFAEGLQAPHTTNVAPGKEVVLYEWNIHLLPKGATSKNLVTIPGTGKFSLHCERIVGPTSFNPNHPNPTLSKLATGKLELEVKADPPAQKQDKQPVKEGITAWGKEVGGLQAGLGYHPGQKRAYSPGETVKLVVRVRNVGKEAVKFQYIKEFFYENPPAVTDGDGKSLPFKGVGFLGEPELVKVNLAPGKENELCEMNLEVQPANERAKDRTWTLYDTGKFQIQYERVGGNIGAGEIKLDPILSKLATGKLELEIKSAPPAQKTEKPPAVFPAGWGGGGGKDYELSVDRTVKHGGKASGSIKSIAAEPTWYGAFTQAFKPDGYRGKRLRMTAYVKSKDIANSAGLWMRIESIDGKGNYSLSSDYMGDRPIKNTNDWKQYEVVLDVPNEDSAQIYFGVMLAGKGQVWVDDFKFEIVDKAVKTTGRVHEPVKSKDGLSKGLPKEPKNLDFEQ